ncbi:hypothetical protein C0992_009071 [Termitomyces sp. T32_za158]|nr:hypothetical protein C0992_009071 [Termitomyces sp. T32_za158]
MDIPDMSILNIDGSAHVQGAVPDDMQKLKAYASSLPYAIEPYHKMIELLDFIILRIIQCVEAKDYEVGLYQWDSMLTYWCMLKYPIPKDRRVQLAKLYFLVSTIPGMPTNVVATCADAFYNLTRSEKKITIEDMRLPWKPIYEILQSDLFLKRRQFEYTQLSWCMGYIASLARRFFSPSAIEEMLQTFVPQLDGTQLNCILAPQYYLLTFLPLTHPQSYLPMLFRMWESVNSYMYDDRMLHFLSKLAEMHVDPSISDPHKIAELPDDERVEGEGRPNWSQAEPRNSIKWEGLYKDVGIFSEHEWQFFMCKCLASMEIPLADAGSLTTGPNADNQASFEIGRLPKPDWRIISLARIIVYSMAPDGKPVPPSNAPTPLFSPLPSGMNTPQIQNSSLNEFLAAPLGKKDPGRTYLAGSKALDSLARLIASTESFFHPSNSGTWTNDLTAFIKYIFYHPGWHEEQQPDCKTPMHRRLTKTMKRELVKSLRTVTLLAMFSQDSATVGNIQSCLKSMSVMEPDLILHPILERAVPSLEALVETQRTIAVIKALGAVAPAIVSRNVYYPGGKHLVYDGVRRRALPVLLKALEPGTDDDRMKGALWTLNSPSLGKYAISALSCFLEPNSLIYSVPTLRVDKAIVQLRVTLGIRDDPEERGLVVRLRDKRMERSQLIENAAQANISSILDVGESEWTHWRYEIVATRALRTLVRRDAPTSPRHLQYFLERVYDDHPTIRYYAQRAVTKIARNIKLRTFCTTPMDLVLMRVRNPLKMKMTIEPSHQVTAKVLKRYVIDTRRYWASAHWSTRIRTLWKSGCRTC